MATREQAYSDCLSVVKNDLAAKVLVDKYFIASDGDYKETRPQQMWERLAIANARAEIKEDVRKTYEKEFYHLLEDFKFVPGGRVLYGLGNPNVNVTLKNCYVMKIRDDSIKGIFQTAYEMAETYKSGGGCGIDITPLRPRGMAVRNAARISSGSVSFMDFFSHITGMIGQNARIGALLISVGVDHPDIEEFITIKGGDLNRVRFANISIRITDAFMRAVASDSNFDLKWQGITFKTVKARELWNKIIHYAWKRAEPGLLFWDTIIRESVPDQYDRFQTITCNPCLTGDMRLLTTSGYKTMRELWREGGYQEYDGNPNFAKHGKLEIINSKGAVSATNVYRTSTLEDVYRVTLENGCRYDATATHRFILNDGSRCALSNLNVGDVLPINQQSAFGPVNYPEYAELAGWVIGDGSVAYTPKDEQVRAIVRTWGNDIENVLPRLRQDAKFVYNRSNKSSNQKPDYEGFDHTPAGFDEPVKEFASSVLGRLLVEDGIIPGDKHKVPNRIWQGDKLTVGAFLRGFFSADGSVQINEKKKCISIRICQVNERILQECQLLLNQFGIVSSVHYERRKPSKKLMNDGKGGKKLYNKKAEHELIISGRNNVEQFINHIGFIQNWKSEIARIWLAAHEGSNNSEVKFESAVKSIEYLDQQETFCLTEPGDNEIVIGGCYLGNCGEAILSDGDSCNLGSINLGKFVTNSFKDDCRFDYSSFEKHVRHGIRFLDNIISLEKSPMEFQQWANDNGRRLGLGVMGLADSFMRMKIKYNSDEAISFTDEIMRRFRDVSYDESCELAKEKGPFPAFEADRHLRSEYIKRLPSEIKQKIDKTGIRHIALHAIAPTGSLQCIAQCSPSIEPIFSVIHYRKTNLGTAKEVQEHEVAHSVAKEYMELSKVSSDKLPSFFVGAHQIEPKSRIKMQQTVQKYIDQAISQTVNLAADVKEEQISEIYQDAWAAGLKGITVYRDGSREGVLSTKKEESKDDSGDEIKIHNAPKRPDALDAVIHVIKPNGKKFSVFVGLLKGRVYEVFALDHTIAGLTDGMAGKIIKKKRDDGLSDYDFESGALLVRKLNGYEDNEASLITRLISTSLRHGTPLEFLIDQISKSRVEMVNFAKAIARALSIYIKKEEVKGKFKCSKCGSKNIKFEGTCYLCLDCGSSKCS